MRYTIQMLDVAYNDDDQLAVMGNMPDESPIMRDAESAHAALDGILDNRTSALYGLGGVGSCYRVTDEGGQAALMHASSPD